MVYRRQYRGYRGKRRTRGIRRNQGTWFPIAGTYWSVEGEEFHDATINDATVSAQSDKSLGTSLNVHPVTLDYTQFPSSGNSPSEGPSLRDFTEGQDYILKRLVGNFTCFLGFGANQQGNFSPTDQWAHILVGCGFFVARAADADQTLPDLTVDEIDPLAAINIQNSWIFRRTWILDNPQNVYPINTSGEFSWEVCSNRDYAGDMNSPFFDTKSKRRIKREERLWFAVSIIGWDGQRIQVGGQNADNPYLNYNLDVRLFGKMVKGRTSPTF